jgi:hypothetical protein
MPPIAAFTQKRFQRNGAQQLYIFAKLTTQPLRRGCTATRTKEFHSATVFQFKPGHVLYDTGD